MADNNSSLEVNGNSSNNQSAENGSRNEPSTSKKSWPNNGRPFERKLGKKRDSTPENGEKSPKRKNVETAKEDEGKEKPSTSQQPLQMQPSTSYATNGYATSDYYPVDPSQNNFMMPQYNMYGPMNQWGAAVNSGMPSMDMASTSSGMGPYPYMVPPDPSMYGMMAPMQGFCPMPMMNGTLPTMQKTMKVFPSGSLHPPPPSAPPPSRRERPNGCKTVFVGGLPEKITEDIVKEAFADCGEIATVRMSKKNFCHIRFTAEHHVDQALFYSGYRIKIENKDEPAYSGRLHVDFAIARDDQYEYECLMRALSREARHANLDDPYRPPSPPPVVNYSEGEAATVGEQLRDEDTFKQACQVLTTWLERGECNKRNAGTFYSMIQSTYSHVRKLVAEKTRIEDELQAVKTKLNQKCASNATHFNDIENVFRCASMQKVWDHFTKPQRRHIDMWKNSTAETKKGNLEDLLEDRVEDEMELSDSEDKDAPVEPDKSELKEQLSNLIEENAKLQEKSESLANQLRNATAETALVKAEADRKNDAVVETCRVVQQNYMDTKKALEEALKEKAALENRENVPVDKSPSTSATSNSTPGLISVTDNEARLVALIATFLNVHPFGASIDYICSFLAKMESSVDTRDVENLMKKFATVFKEESTGIGATLEKKWTFLGFNYRN